MSHFMIQSNCWSTKLSIDQGLRIQFTKKGRFKLIWCVFNFRMIDSIDVEVFLFSQVPLFVHNSFMRVI